MGRGEESGEDLVESRLKLDIGTVFKYFEKQP